MTVIGGSTDHLVVDRAGNAQADRVLDVQTLAGTAVTDVTAPTGWTGEAFPTGQARADGDGYFTFVVPDATGPVQVRTAAYSVGTRTFEAGPWLTPSGQIVPDSGVDQALDARVLTADLPTVDLSGNASLSATYARLGEAVPFTVLASDPDQLVSGAITRNSAGAATSAPVTWPDGQPGTYTGTASTTFSGLIDSYLITYGSPVTRNYRQPAVTRDSSGQVTNRPAITLEMI